MIRWGLCCQFREQPIKFRTITARMLGRYSRAEALEKISSLCLANAQALAAALQYCADNGIGCFRILSQILPLKTHPVLGYEIEELPGQEEIVRRYRLAGELARRNGLRTSFHPDQFVVLNSPRPEVVAASVREIEYQAQVAEWVGADVINIHAGGAYGDKAQALAALARNLSIFSARARAMLTLENDDTTYTPADLLPLCRAENIPLVYDVHHHRCLGDELSIEQATDEASATWNREQLVHISSPLEGWTGIKPWRHSENIDPQDFPDYWTSLDLTVEVEAKAKELAVKDLSAALLASRIRNS